MRILPTGLQTHLDSGTTTLCHCWRLTLRSGEKLGFTDHDRALTFDATAFESQAGFTGSDIESSLGLSIDNLEAAGALKSGSLDETRLRAGDFDHAAVEIWRVNWSSVSQRVLLRKGHLGEVSWGGGTFNAEVRGLAHLFNQQQGRLYQYGCDAELGDARCGVSLETGAYKGTGVISSVDGATLLVSGINSFVSEWFTLGIVAWETGANAGRKLMIRRHRLQASTARIDLWQTPPFTVAAGESVVLRAGCDKQFTTCKVKFSNTENFRGFPHMPGNDVVMAFASPEDASNNSGSRN
jgi:uncharacterized phage protein (TIGR02218 family)